MIVPWVAAAGVSYLLGSIPSGLLIGKLYRGIDVRDYGSHRTGATNVLRTVGKGAAAVALLMDAAKGAAAILAARWLLPGEPWADVLAAFGATAGHNWPVFSRFRGGRGVIVSAAAVGMLHPPTLALMAVAGLAVVWRTRFVSLGSIVGAAVAPPLFYVFYLRGDVPFPYVAYALAGAVLVIGSHRDNIQRLLAGIEARLGQRAQRAA